jgi:hypothetical protein
LFNGQSQAARNMRSPDQQDEAESSAANDFPALRCAFLHFHFVSMSFPICSLHLNSLAFNSFTTVSYYHIIFETVENCVQ